MRYIYFAPGVPEAARLLDPSLTHEHVLVFSLSLSFSRYFLAIERKRDASGTPHTYVYLAVFLIGS